VTIAHSQIVPVTSANFSRDSLFIVYSAAPGVSAEMQPQHKGERSPLLYRYDTAVYNLTNKDHWFMHKALVGICEEIVNTGMWGITDLSTIPTLQGHCRCDACMIDTTQRTAKMGTRISALKTQMKLV